MLTASYRELIDRPTDIEFSLTNTGSKTVFFLYWNTFFDRLCPSTIIIKNKSSEIVEYRGARAKRQFDATASLIAIEAGETISEIINISENYSLPSESVYSIQLRDDQFRGFEEKIPEDAQPYMLTALNFKLTSDSQVKLKPSAYRNQLPDAQPIIHAAPPMCSILCVGISYALDPVCVMGKVDYAHAKIHNATQPQTKTIRDAIVNLFSRQIGGRPISIINDAIFIKWFGKYSDESALKVHKIISGIKSQAKCKSFEFYVMFGCEKPDTIAFFKKSTIDTQNDMISLCRLFFTLNSVGHNSQVGTIAHEISHGYANTQDYAYGANDCMALAKTQPNLALENAESIEFYLEDKVLSLAEKEYKEV